MLHSGAKGEWNCLRFRVFLAQPESFWGIPLAERVELQCWQMIDFADYADSTTAVIALLSFTS